MKFNFNIFSNINNGGNSRLRKIIRNTLKEGMIDTFNIVLGDHGTTKYLEKNETKTMLFGLIDILLFPPISQLMIRYGRPQEPIKKQGKLKLVDGKISVLGNVISILGLLLQIPRVLVAIFVTIVLFPVVFAFHLIKYPFVYRLQNAFYQLQGLNYLLGPINSPSSKETYIVLKDYVKNTNSTLNQLERNNNPGDIITAKSLKNTLFAPDKMSPVYYPYSFFKIDHSNSDAKQEQALSSGHILGVL